MRICRYRNREGREALGLDFDDAIVAFDSIPGLSAGLAGSVAMDAEMFALMEPYEEPPARKGVSIPVTSVELLAPIPFPGKILLLAGNYASHIAEEGLIVAERAETFPYLFMKPISTLNHPNAV